MLPTDPRSVTDRWRIGADVGGTFTDVLLQADDGHTSLRKVLSTPPEYERAVVDAVAYLLETEETNGDVGAVIHGTTVATNAVLQRRGSLTALVTTAGFRDVLELRRLRTPHMYDPHWRKPLPLVERRLRFEIAERVTASGEVLLAPNEDEVFDLADRLAAAGVEAVGVCFLHSYRYPTHEQLVGEILRSRLPGIAISLSCEILHEQGEYERTATTVVNAYVRPLMAGYLQRLETGLGDLGVRGPLMIMQSSGGVMTSDDAADRPVYALESGPAAGVIAALGVAQVHAHADAIAFDMGGTTAKASLIEAGRVARGREYEAGGALSSGTRLIRGSGELLRIPTIDIAEVGAGGGSIAWLDAAEGLHVGPRSAGADPGPACYGRNGKEPTVTDANVVLGYMRTGAIGDGELAISRERAQQALEPIANQLGLSLTETARGVHELANAAMMRALRSVSSERGRDPRNFVLIAYGGAGPIHAAGLAEDLGVTTVLVPVFAGLFSAAGLLFASPELHDVRACNLDARACDLTAVNALYDEMERALSASFPPAADITWTRTADLRYLGQSWEVETDVPTGELDAESLRATVRSFESEHERLYGVRGDEDAPVQLRAVRLAAVLNGQGPKSLSPRSLPRGSDEDKNKTRVVHFQDGERKVAVTDRQSISVEAHAGPLLIDEYDTTVVVPPSWTIRRAEPAQTLILERKDT